jgi:molybdate transport system permease protein
LPDALSEAATAGGRRSRLAAVAWPVLVGVLSGALLLLVLLPIAGLLFTSSPARLLRGLGDPLVGPAIRLTLVTTIASLALIVACGTPLAWLIAHRPGRL